MVSRLLIPAVFLAAAFNPVYGAAKGPKARTILSLDGTWEVGESVLETPMPSEFAHKAPVPGLANLATPPFAEVDRFDSRELIEGEIGENKRPESDRTTAAGKPHQARNYFWYRSTFQVKGEVDTRPQAANDIAQSIAVPQLISWIAKYQDKDAQGKPIKRDAKTTMEHIKEAVPGLRETLPVKQ